VRQFWTLSAQIRDPNKLGTQVERKLLDVGSRYFRRVKL